MKITIHRDNDRIRAELTADTNKPPVVLSMTPEQVELVRNVLASALRAEKFSFSLEME